LVEGQESQNAKWLMWWEKLFGCAWDWREGMAYAKIWHATIAP